MKDTIPLDFRNFNLIVRSIADNACRAYFRENSDTNYKIYLRLTDLEDNIKKEFKALVEHPEYSVWVRAELLVKDFIDEIKRLEDENYD